eukprot:1419664-Prymnesium_polylepis.1
MARAARAAEGMEAEVATRVGLALQQALASARGEWEAQAAAEAASVAAEAVARRAELQVQMRAEGERLKGHAAMLEETVG